ncbi:MAG: glycosyltransferase [Xanthobacteraceae bacterium]|nr:glycosyltransferase [Xanthobacteraceae bacterium]
MTRRLRALMLAPAMPAPGGNGLAMRLNLFLQALTRIADVDLVVAPLFGPLRMDAIDCSKDTGLRVHVIDMARAVDTHFGLLMRVIDPPARADAFARFGKPSLAARIAPKAFEQVPDEIKTRRYDIIHAARSYLAPLSLEFCGKNLQRRRPLLTLDLDEDDGRVFDGLAGLAARHGNRSDQRWLTLEANAFRRLVDAVVPAFDRVWVASPTDAARLRSRFHSPGIRVFPNTVAGSPALRRSDARRMLLFVGSLGYEPNRDAVEWLLRDIWPKLRHVSNLELRIAGGGAPERLRRLAGQRGATMLGWVQDLDRHLRAATMMIAPIRVGAGTRIKVLESAMQGVPIVTTPLGAEGLGLSPKHHIWLAEDAVAFAATITYALANAAERRRRANLARSYVASRFRLQHNVARLAQQLLDGV